MRLSAALKYICSDIPLTAEPLPRFPVLLAIDDFQALYNMSLYRDPFYKPVKAYHLSFPRTLLEFASGKQTFVGFF